MQRSRKDTGVLSRPSSVELRGGRPSHRKGSFLLRINVSGLDAEREMDTSCTRLPNEDQYEDSSFWIAEIDRLHDMCG